LSRSSDDDDDDDVGAPPYDEIDEIPTLLFSNSHEEHLDFDLLLFCVFLVFCDTQEGDYGDG
jgi:hypothetical protein